MGDGHSDRQTEKVNYRELSLDHKKILTFYNFIHKLFKNMFLNVGYVAILTSSVHLSECLSHGLYIEIFRSFRKVLLWTLLLRSCGRYSPCFFNEPLHFLSKS